MDADRVDLSARLEPVLREIAAAPTIFTRFRPRATIC